MFYFYKLSYNVTIVHLHTYIYIYTILSGSDDFANDDSFIEENGLSINEIPFEGIYVYVCIVIVKHTVGNDLVRNNFVYYFFRFHLSFPFSFSFSFSFSF